MLINYSADNHKVLLVLHEFSRTGAPKAVLYLARALFEISGFRPVIAAPFGGSIIEEFEREGFPTIIEPLLFEADTGNNIYKFVSMFETVIVTPLPSFGFIRHHSAAAKHLIWWIHEEEKGFTYIANAVAPDLAQLCDACDALWLGSPLCFAPAKRYTAPEKLKLLLYGCNDVSTPPQQHQSKKMVFSLVGSLEPRKGQDIFLEAIKLVPEHLRCQCEFKIIGSTTSDYFSRFEETIFKRARLIPEVECIPNVPFERLIELYSQTDVVVSASRADPMPIAITQGLMFSKTCLCSSAVGHAELIKDGENGIIFENESSEDLADKISWLICNPAKSLEIGFAGRKVFDEKFLMSSFVANVNHLLQERRVPKIMKTNQLKINFKTLTFVVLAIIIAAVAVFTVGYLAKSPVVIVESIPRGGVATTSLDPEAMKAEVNSSGLTLFLPNCDISKYQDKFFVHVYTEAAVANTPPKFINFDFFLADEKKSEKIVNNVKGCSFHKNFSEFPVKELLFGQFSAPNNQCCTIIWSRAYIFNKNLSDK